MYPFSIVISRQARLVPVSTLASDHKIALLGQDADQPDANDVFEFSVLAEYMPRAKGNKRRRRRKRYANTDRVVISVRSPHKEVQFLSAYPSTTLNTGQVAPNFAVPILSNHKPSGRAKDLVRRNRYSVVTSCTPETVQWVFSKPYIEALVDRTFLLQLRLSIHDAPTAEQRQILCTATFSHKGRTLEQKSSTIELPLP